MGKKSQASKTRKRKARRSRVLYLTIKDLKDLGILKNDKNQWIDPKTGKPITIDSIKGSSDHMRGFGQTMPANYNNTNNDATTAALIQRSKEDYDKKISMVEDQKTEPTRFDYNNNPRLTALDNQVNDLLTGYEGLTDMIFTERQNFDERLRSQRQDLTQIKNYYNFKNKDNTYDFNDNVGLSPAPVNGEVMQNGGDALQDPNQNVTIRDLSHYSTAIEPNEDTDDDNNDDDNAPIRIIKNSSNKSIMSEDVFTEDPEDEPIPIGKEPVLSEKEAAVEPAKEELKEEPAKEQHPVKKEFKIKYSEFLPEIHEVHVGRGGIATTGKEYESMTRERIYYEWNRMIRDLKLQPGMTQEDKDALNTMKFAEIKKLIQERGLGLESYFIFKK
jgi:hypothetical protein